MSLLEETKEAKEQLAEALKAEAPAEEEIEAEEKQSDAEEAPVEEAIQETTEKEDDEPKKEEIKEEKPDDSAFARLRREAAANKRKADEMERQITELKKPKEDAEYAVPQVDAELEQVIKDNRIRNAEKEFMRYESDVLRADPANAHIMNEYTQAIQGSLRLQNPRASLFEIAEMTKLELFRQAGSYQNDGYANPVEEMVNVAKELGFTGKSFAPKTEEKEVNIKPDMKKVAENRKRSAGMTSAAGREDGLVSKKTAAEMSPSEWKALPREERARLMSA